MKSRAPDPGEPFIHRPSGHGEHHARWRLRIEDEMARYAELVYTGFGSRARDVAGGHRHGSKRVNGTVRLKLYKGNVIDRPEISEFPV